MHQEVLDKERRARNAEKAKLYRQRKLGSMSSKERASWTAKETARKQRYREKNRGVPVSMTPEEKAIRTAKETARKQRYRKKKKAQQQEEQLPTPTTRRSLRIIHQSPQQQQQQQPLSPPLQPSSTMQCGVCGFLPSKTIMEVAKKLTSFDYNQLQEEKKCINCVENDYHQQKMIRHDTNLEELYQKQKEDNVNCFKTEYNVTVDVTDFIGKQSLPLVALDTISKLCGGEISVTVKELNNNIPDDEYNTKDQEISRSTWNGDGDDHPNLVCRDKKTDITFIRCGERKGAVGSYQNFLALYKLNGDEDKIDSFCNDEYKVIKTQPLCSRAGAAPGFHLIGDTSLCLTKVTQKDTSLFVSTKHETSVGKRVVYINDYNKVMTTSWTTKAILMNRLNTKEKQQQAQKNKSYRHILFCEAIAYLKVLAVMDRCGVKPIQNNMTCIPQLKRILTKNVNNSVEDCLVEWMCTTGEMRNYQALACHTDGNTSHHIELYTLFGRGDGIQKKDGLLYLPLHNAVIRIGCNDEGMACNLTHTPHVPDKTRNTNNFSKVHGPKP